MKDSRALLRLDIELFMVSIVKGPIPFHFEDPCPLGLQCIETVVAQVM